MTIVRGARPRDLAIAIESLIVLAAIRLAARQSSLPACEAAADRLSGARTAAVDVRPERAARIVARVVGRFAWQTCLMQAIVLSVVLRRRGHETQVVVGAARDVSSRAFSAHAWLRCGDQTFFEDAARSFVPLHSLIGAGTIQ